MRTYPDEISLSEGRERYFRDNGFTDGGYDETWVKLKVGPLPFAFPNTASRKRAVRLHDLHHVLTGYDTTWTGEGEIAAWELASGCADHYAAWILNLAAAAVGFVIAPTRMLAACRRGRRSRNFYRTEYETIDLSQSVGSYRRSMLPD